MVNSEESIDTSEILTLYGRFRINRCRYKRVQQYIGLSGTEFYKRMYSVSSYEHLAHVLHRKA